MVELNAVSISKVLSESIKAAQSTDINEIEANLNGVYTPTAQDSKEDKVEVSKPRATTKNDKDKINSFSQDIAIADFKGEVTKETTAILAKAIAKSKETIKTDTKNIAINYMHANSTDSLSPSGMKAVEDSALDNAYRKNTKALEVVSVEADSSKQAQSFAKTALDVVYGKKGTTDLAKEISSAFSDKNPVYIDDTGTVAALTDFTSATKNATSATKFVNDNMKDVLSKYNCATADQLKGMIAANPSLKDSVAKDIAAWTKDNYTYVSDTGENWSTFSETVNQFKTEGKIEGDCEDISIFMTNVMNSVGINASLTVNPGENGGKEGHVVVTTDNGDGTVNLYDATGTINDSKISKIEISNLGYKFNVNNENVTSISGGKVDTFYAFSTDGYRTSDGTSTDGTDEGFNSTDPDMIDLNNAYEAGKESGHSMDELFKAAIAKGVASYPLTGDVNTVEGTLANTSCTINGLYKSMQLLANYMSCNTDAFSDPGSLFLMQTKLQMIKDAIAAVTAIGKSVADTITEALKAFVSATNQI